MKRLLSVILAASLAANASFAIGVSRHACASYAVGARPLFENQAIVRGPDWVRRAIFPHAFQVRTQAFSALILGHSLRVIRFPRLRRIVFAVLLALPSLQGAQPPLWDKFDDQFVHMGIEREWAKSKQIFEEIRQAYELTLNKSFQNFTATEKETLWKEQLDQMTMGWDWQVEKNRGTIEFDTRGPFELTYNSLRANRYLLQPEAVKPVLNPEPFYLKGSVPVLGRLSSLGGRLRYVIGNKFSFGQDHISVFSAQKRPQFLTLNDIEAALDALDQSKSQNLRFVFNGWGAAASINFMHEQGIYLEAKAGERPHLPVESFRGDLVAETGSVSIYREKQGAEGWPARALYFSGANKREVAAALSRSADLLQARAIPHNVMFRKEMTPEGKAIFHAILFPRSDVGEVSETSKTRPAAFEFCGLSILTNRELYDAATEAQIRKVLDEMSLSESGMRDFVRTLHENLIHQPLNGIYREQETASNLMADVYEMLYPGSPLNTPTELKPGAPIPKRLSALFAADPVGVRSQIERLKQGRPITATPLADGSLAAAPNPKFISAVDALLSRLDGLAQIPARLPPAVRWLFIDWGGTIYDPATRSVLPGARKFLEAVKQTGTKTCVITYNEEPLVSGLIQELGLSDVITMVRGVPPGRSVTKGHKTKLIQDALTELRLLPVEAATMGDSPQDVEEGRDAGVFTIALEHSENQAQAFAQFHPDLEVRNLENPAPIVQFLSEEAPGRFNQQAYDSAAVKFAERWAKTGELKGDIKKWMDQFRKMLSPTGGILDAGTGAGYKAKNLFEAERAEGRMRVVTGIDSSPAMISEAIARYGKVDSNLRFVVAHLDEAHETLQGQAGIWDDGSFHHLPPRMAASVLESQWRTLNAGGALFMLGKQGPEQGLRAHVETNMELGITRIFYRHDPRSLRAFAEAHGFIVEECRTQERPAHLAAQGQTDDDWVYLFARKPGLLTWRYFHHVGFWLWIRDLVSQGIFAGATELSTSSALFSKGRSGRIPDSLYDHKVREAV